MVQEREAAAEGAVVTAAVMAQAELATEAGEAGVKAAIVAVAEVVTRARVGAMVECTGECRAAGMGEGG